MTPRCDILLVEDSAADAEIFQQALKEVDAETRACWVSSGKEALEFLSKEGTYLAAGSVRLIVLDLDLPMQNGLELLEAIKRTPIINRVPVVMFSATSSTSKIKQAYSLGANVFFRKPLSFSQYVERVRVLVQHWLKHAVLPLLIS